jgi:pilus assembly protein CpaF
VSKSAPPVHEWVDEVCVRVASRSGDVETLVAEEVRRVAPLAVPDQRAAIERASVARLRGLGELQPLVDDPRIDEVLVNAGSEIWVDRGGRLERAGTLVGHGLDHLVERILAPLGRRVDRSSPVVDARLADGSRVCAVVPPVSVDGPCLSIRRFPATARSLHEFADDVGVEMCRRIVDSRCNVVVSGATSSGKTSFLAALLTEVDGDERLVVIEDTTELPIRSGHVLRLEARPPTVDAPVAVTLPDLVRTALRLRPDRLVLGEVRGDEVVAVVQALNTGHDGSFTTCHANGTLDALFRLETLLVQAAPRWPLAAIRQQLRRSIDVVVHVARTSGGRRRVVEIAEVVPPAPDDPGHPPTVRPLAHPVDGALVEVDDLHRTRAGIAT